MKSSLYSLDLMMFLLESSANIVLYYRFIFLITYKLDAGLYQLHYRVVGIHSVQRLRGVKELTNPFFLRLKYFRM